jgi:SAM-dependent methyltransferase
MIYYIYHDGRHYDRLFPGADPRGVSKDLSFWRWQARDYGGPVLELGCGTGRVAIPLAEEGFKVTGIDIAGGMLQEAQRKASVAKVGVTWANADMRDFDLNDEFSLIILPNNTICHLLTRTDIESCLASARKHLAPKGKFVIDVFVPKMELLVDQPEAKFPFGEYDDPDGGGKIVVTETYVYEPDTQIKRVTTWFSFPGNQDPVPKELDMRMYFPQELDALLEYNGFVIDQKYGDYLGAPFSHESTKQLIVCSAAV